MEKTKVDDASARFSLRPDGRTPDRLRFLNDCGPPKGDFSGKRVCMIQDYIFTAYYSIYPVEIQASNTAIRRRRMRRCGLIISIR